MHTVELRDTDRWRVRFKRKTLRTIAVSALIAIALLAAIWLAPPDEPICAREWFGACLDDVWQTK